MGRGLSPAPMIVRGWVPPGHGSQGWLARKQGLWGRGIPQLCGGPDGQHAEGGFRIFLWEPLPAAPPLGTAVPAVSPPARRAWRVAGGCRMGHRALPARPLGPSGAGQVGAAALGRAGSLPSHGADTGGEFANKDSYSWPACTTVLVAPVPTVSREPPAPQPQS